MSVSATDFWTEASVDRKTPEAIAITIIATISSARVNHASFERSRARIRISAPRARRRLVDRLRDQGSERDVDLEVDDLAAVDPDVVGDRAQDRRPDRRLGLRARDRPRTRRRGRGGRDLL